MYIHRWNSYLHLIQLTYYRNIIQYINKYYLQLLTIYNTYTYRYYTYIQSVSNYEIKSY